MSVVIVPLNQIILDPANPVDLTSVPVEDALQLIRASYGFLSSIMDIDCGLDFSEAYELARDGFGAVVH